MHLACIFFLSIVALCSVKISKAEIPRAQPHSFDLKLDSSNERDTEDDVDIIRRAVRKYPEESEHINRGHRQASIRESPVECSCPTMLTRGTLVAIVAALAFLGFFSTSILLVVAVCILRLVEKQKKKEKDEKPTRSSSRRRAPPVPPPRPEHTYMKVKSLHGYERLHPASPRAARGVYLSASELNPGPKVSRERSYQNTKTTPPEPKSTPENEYIAPGQAPAFSTPPLENKYVNADRSQPASHSSLRMSSVQDTVRSPLLSPKGRENHIYEEVE